MHFESLPEFDKDLKYLLKRYRTLIEDLEILKKVLSKMPNERPPFSFRISNLGLKTYIVKVKRISCKALKGKGSNTGLRLIYAYYPEKKKIILIEIYHKNDKENEDKERIFNNFE